jgi:hypothetical protein
MHINKFIFNVSIVLPIIGWLALNIYLAIVIGRDEASIFLLAWIAYVIPHLLYKKRVKDSSHPYLWIVSSISLVLFAVFAWFLLEHHGWLVIYGPIYYLSAGIVLWCLVMLIDLGWLIISKARD